MNLLVTLSAVLRIIERIEGYVVGEVVLESGERLVILAIQRMVQNE